ncbi:hypothetical protein [Rhodovulum strictum]|uniref:Carboxypeptidase regulatory-like domain-containing protein n=1 Tax=Rhodovulum strictum TaxID=58314 RepID=A0A844BQD1_9RHOB|nr:hypothetical protein [Rhodovulum strictum]MRH22167.1 hypothetical protein [Rhodovulum strictum]
MRLDLRLPVTLAALIGLAGAALAHTPLCSCYDNGDGTVLCEGGFSDGASAAGVKMSVMDGSGAALIEGAIDANGEFVFDKPEGAFSVIFDAGEGHRITISSDAIY